MRSKHLLKTKTAPNPRLTKREFLRFCATGLCIYSATDLLGLPNPFAAPLPKNGLIETKLAAYFTPLDGRKIQCDLCPHRCLVAQGKRGVCRVRENREGKYYSLVYGNPCSVHLDPVEKKPFFHVLPGTASYSLATAGCNFQCKFCQNWEISQAFPEDVSSKEFSPARVVREAKETGARSVAYTYVEPTIFYEYMIDIATLARKSGLLNVYHSNGFINPGPLQHLCKVLDAANIDLKGFTDDFYHNLCGGELAPVLETLKTLKKEKVHLEITNLIIPTKNDDPSVLKDMCRWIRNELGPDTPVHFSRFYPLYRLKTLPPTPVSTLEKAREIGLSAGLDYVYIGNIPGHAGENTFCPKCGKMIIQRKAYMVGEVHLKDGKCKSCGKPIAGIWV